METVSKKLVCHNDKIEFSEDIFTGLTLGKAYDVTREIGEAYFVIVDDGFEEGFTKEPDEDGHSYKNWFTLVEECIEVDE